MMRASKGSSPDSGPAGSVAHPTAAFLPDLDNRAIEELRGFWTFYGTHDEAVLNELREASGADRRALVDQIVALQPRLRMLRRDAILGGHWQPYFQALWALGEGYARADVSHHSWLGLLTAFRDQVRQHLFARALGGEDSWSQVASQIAGMDHLLDIAQHAITGAYLAAREERLSEGGRHYRSMFEHSPSPMWMFERDSMRFVAVNEAAILQYGYSREEFATMTLADLRPPEDVAALEEDVRRASGLVEPRRWRHRKKDGSIIKASIRANDYVFEGRPVRLVIANDVTEIERSEELLEKTRAQLRQAQKMEAVGRLAGGVAHDFNNVLTVIQGYASLLEDGLDPADARREDATEIRRAGERAAAITRQLLLLSRHSVTRPQSVEASDLVGGFLPMLRRLVGEGVDVVTHLRKVPPVVVDPGQLEQVLMNLAINARDAMPDGGRLTIETELSEIEGDAGGARGLAPGSYVGLAVTDTGSGIPAEVRERMFDPFFTTKEVGKGTGLGLSIAHGIVAQAGGNIRVYSELGHGTTFRVHLPVNGESVPAPSEEVAITAPETLGPWTVLVVDDDLEVRSLSKRILEDAGCRVLEAASGAEAAQLCVRHEGPIELAVIDVVLSDGRGDALIHQLRELRPELDLVLMSGYPAGALSPAGGAPPDLLSKPFTPGELRAAAARAVGVVPEGTAAVRQVRVAKSGEARQRVLLVDDDADLRRAFSRILAELGLEVVEAENATEAIAALEAAPCDVILTDLHMPGGSGLDLLRQVRRIDLDLPVILMTGMPDVESAAAAVEQGAFRYLTKPVHPEAVGKTVQHAARAYALARLRREALSLSGTHVGAADRAGLEVRFDQAMERLWMAYQPVVEASSGALFGVEALLRSHESSMPTPRALLDAATQLGRLPRLGRRVRELCATAFTDVPEPTVLFVNLHPDDLLDADLVDPSAALSQIAGRVILEITERETLDQSPDLLPRVERLRAMGFRLAIDDIGAGYSGLRTFTELMPEFVKIDMSLVRDIHLSALKQRTVGALCRLCHEIGCVVVGEGVETLDERDALAGVGCDLLQGYLLGRPSGQLPP